VYNQVFSLHPKMNFLLKPKLYFKSYRELPCFWGVTYEFFLKGEIKNEHKFWGFISEKK
jgi:hypothetical protein